MKRVWVVLLALSACAPRETPEPWAPSEVSEPPNVLLISLDTTRADHCSVYGYRRDTTPTLERIAEEGALFEVAYAPTSTTGPSHASLFTSLYPMEHGVVKNGVILDDSFTTLAEHLSANGYETAGFVSSFVLHPKFGYAQGFDHYDAETEVETATVTKSEWLGHTITNGFDRRGEATTDRALEWLQTDRDADAPFFMFVHYFDPHDPYEPPEPYKSDFKPTQWFPDDLDRDIAHYDGSIAYADAQIGRLLDALEASGLTDNTLVLVVADHGEGLMDHGDMYHGRYIYEEYVRVPFLVRWPARIPPETRFEAPVDLHDVARTVFDLVGVDHSELTLNGRSLAAPLRGQTPYAESDRPMFLFRRHFEHGPNPRLRGELYGVRTGDWKYVRGPDERRTELYDLRRDPGEQTNLADDEPERVAALQTLLDDWLAAHPRYQAETAMSDEDREALEALGYVE